MFCVYCGKELGEGHKFCGYCGAKMIEANSTSTAKKEKGNWPVAVFKDSSWDEITYFCYDVETGCETDEFKTKKEAINEITKELNNWKDSAWKIPTEESIETDKYVKKLIKKDCELSIEYIVVSNFEPVE